MRAAIVVAVLLVLCIGSMANAATLAITGADAVRVQPFSDEPSFMAFAINLKLPFSVPDYVTPTVIIRETGGGLELDPGISLVVTDPMGLPIKMGVTYLVSDVQAGWFVGATLFNTPL